MQLAFVPAVGLGVNPPCTTDGCRAVLAQLPSCYSSQFDACADELDAAHRRSETNPVLSPQCQQYWTIQQKSDTAYGRAAWDSAIDAMPHCPEPSGARTVGMGIGGLVVGGLIGLGLGLALAAALGL